jgi:hypothetical protein
MTNSRRSIAPIVGKEEDLILSCPLLRSRPRAWGKEFLTKCGPVDSVTLSQKTGVPICQKLPVSLASVQSLSASARVGAACRQLSTTLATQSQRTSGTDVCFVELVRSTKQPRQTHLVRARVGCPLDALSTVTGIPVTELIQVVVGGTPHLQGTWASRPRARGLPTRTHTSRTGDGIRGAVEGGECVSNLINALLQK